MTELHVASSAAKRLRDWTPKAQDHAFVESVEVVWVDGSVGLDVRWTQVTSDHGQQRFGLLTTVSELVEDCSDADALEWAAEALLIAVQEPHAPSRNDMRTMFRRLP
jgi:hypothetical protein